MNLSQRVNDLQKYIQNGKILEAMTEFYAKDCRMQENSGAPCVGLEANLAREKQFLSQVKEWKGYTAKSLGVGDGVTMVESAMDFVNQQNQAVHMEQVAVQQWKDGKIVHERFYYDSGAK